MPSDEHTGRSLCSTLTGNLYHKSSRSHGILYVTYQGLPELDQAETEFLDTMSEIVPELAGNIVVLNMNIQYELISFDPLYDTALQENPQYKHWLCIVRSTNDAVRASSAFVRNGFENSAHIFGSSAPEEIFVEDEMPQIKMVFTMPYELQVEPIIGALYGFMTGELSPETIWGGNENGCGSAVIYDYYVVTRENYADYCLKLDEYLS